jgi:signal transduction histidine kinase
MMAEKALDELTRWYAQGKITLECFEERVEHYLRGAMDGRGTEQYGKRFDRSPSAAAPTMGTVVTMTLFRRTVRASAWALLLVDLFVVVVWAASGGGSFWPVWVWLPTGLAIGSAWWATTAPNKLAHAAGDAVLVSLFLIGVWAAAGGGSFWPVYPIAVLALAFGLGAIKRGEKDEARVEELTQSRAGAVEASESQLRRIERDLHDGAQARLVALGMNLGLAEQQLSKDPEKAQEHLAEARTAAAAALQELRDLARGIHPPILADRGLDAAIHALADHAGVPVAVHVELTERPPETVETAAYFVAAEGLANALKHAQASRIDIDVHEWDHAIVVRVLDDGRGGAAENGGGLHGLRQRVQALDGSLRIASPEGGPTVIEAVLPCAR